MEVGLRSSVFEVIAEAIRNRQTVVATYHGHRRKMCPHILGRNKNGREQCLFYQFGGTSSKGIEPDGSPDNWRCIPVRELVNVEVVDGSWHTANNHSRPQTCVVRVHIEVDWRR